MTTTSLIHTFVRHETKTGRRCGWEDTVRGRTDADTSRVHEFRPQMEARWGATWCGANAFFFLLFSFFSLFLI